jgi:hypothetical protein
MQLAVLLRIQKDSPLRNSKCHTFSPSEVRSDSERHYRAGAGAGFDFRTGCRKTTSVHLQHVEPQHTAAARKTLGLLSTDRDRQKVTHSRSQMTWQKPQNCSSEASRRQRGTFQAVICILVIRQLLQFFHCWQKQRWPPSPTNRLFDQDGTGVDNWVNLIVCPGIVYDFESRH